MKSLDKKKSKSQTEGKKVMVLNKTQWKFRKQAQEQFPDAIIIKDKPMKSKSSEGKGIKETFENVGQTCQATPEELKASHRRCWWTGCKHRAWLDLWGWHWCLKHWWQDYRWGGGEQSLKALYLHIKYSKIRL